MSTTTTAAAATATATQVETMQDLVSQLRQTMTDSGGALGDDPKAVRQVRRLMNSYVSQSQDWNKYAVYHEGTSYTRNLVDDGNGKYNLLILVWGEGKGSPIHDHAGSHCMMKLLDGELTEDLFAWPTSPSSTMRLRRSSPLKTNSVAYMHDKIGLHRIENPSSKVKAVSLHLYSPPYNMCKTFDEHTGHCTKSSCAAQKLTTGSAPILKHQISSSCTSLSKAITSI